MSDPWPVTDPLGEVLHHLRMSGAYYALSEVTEPWGIALPPFPDRLMFHVVARGRCWLEAGGEAPHPMREGDIVLVPHGAGHRLSSAPGVEGTALFDLPREQVSERYEVLRHGGGGEPATLVCGVAAFDHPAARHLVSLLPARIAFEALDSPETGASHALVRLMAAEARALHPGGESIITRLADILVIQAIRAWMDRDPAAHAGWLGALRDRRIGRAIALIHRDPARPWSVASLAGEVAMSRSAFAARFTALVGEPVMRYVARWRMYVAATWLREEATPLAALAERLGYQSEAAFSRAFKRYVGVAPGRLRAG